MKMQNYLVFTFYFKLNDVQQTKFHFCQRMVGIIVFLFYFVSNFIKYTEMHQKQSKAYQIRVERELDKLFKLPGNDRCADCGARNPRWASYSLGVLLCVRCASLHRKMGTHISKVKSVSMDCWTLQEIQNIEALGGNQAVNKHVNFKAKLPLTTDDDLLMEKFIRDKWEKKLFQEQLEITEEHIVPTPTLSSTESSEISSPVPQGRQLSSTQQHQVPPPSISLYSSSQSQLPSTSTTVEQQSPTKYYSRSATMPTTLNPANPFNILVNSSNNNAHSTFNNNNPFRSYAHTSSQDLVDNAVSSNNSVNTQQQHLYSDSRHNGPIRASTLPIISTTSHNPFLPQHQHTIIQPQSTEQPPLW
ncbi:hypothetical protein BDF20DRAFT_851171 [Mycotypha africana]|uniref:uncharacterized protein n=1 Tax=Mycotypha africana TaxID=64632 RepID=UPI002300F543|nr:uncharacterized protein BDF20DRAFT_851171 [Mycotypha africana]KAI8987614.1 hypothetical protein BDF20DRAFT_851171 [Mycotypha africana]